MQGGPLGQMMTMTPSAGHAPMGTSPETLAMEMSMPIYPSIPGGPEPSYVDKKNFKKMQKQLKKDAKGK